MWAAVSSRGRTAAKATGIPADKLQRQFVYDRFLARLFTYAPDGDWVLKGGTALLARVRTARHSRDIDLFRRTGTLDNAVTELRAAAALDLDDHFRFVFTSAAPKFQDERPGQPDSRLATVKITSYAGVTKAADFTVDVVIGSIITGDPEPRQSAPTITMPGIEPPRCLLYPVADHIADKVCATFERHGSALLPSSRVRDLVDLVVIARTQRVDADALRTAIIAERDHRGLDPITRWACPHQWASSYPRLARDVAECQEHRTFEAATAFVGSFLDPILAAGLINATWHPHQRCWTNSALAG
nr:nucleotidyl transferase AbiEii/AbiGii toxin family protein [Pseudonocardia acidicola]